MPLKVGQRAPDFTLVDQDMTQHSLSDYQNRWVLLYFYPKDDTPGCTAEACAIRDNWVDFAKRDIVVLGVSVDSAESHQKFLQKYGLPFFLLADTDKKVVKKYHVWQRKKLFGHEFDGILRQSFIINPEGFIAKIYEKVKPQEHAQEILADLDVLQQGDKL